VLLLTVPCISQLEPKWDDLWRWTPLGLDRFLDGVLPADAERESSAHGNVLTAIAFLLGLAAEDLADADYATDDAAYPLVVCVRIRKPSPPGS
jgi:hypothetical protein